MFNHSHIGTYYQVVDTYISYFRLLPDAYEAAPIRKPTEEASETSSLAA